jgi:hypothetical protein
MIFIQNMCGGTAPRHVIKTTGLYLLKAETVTVYIVNDITNCLHF